MAQNSPFKVYNSVSFRTEFRAEQPLLFLNSENYHHSQRNPTGTSTLHHLLPQALVYGNSPSVSMNLTILGIFIIE
jgi:hypothetical protein